jgi:integrase
MRYSGLRIGDTIALDNSRLSGNKLLLYTAKTGTPVYVPLPPVVMTALGLLEVHASGRFFSTGDAKPQTARANWSRYLDSLFELANVRGAHSHRFRDTFAVSLLLKGVSLESVSKLLGHSSIKVTERHYAPWVKARQTILEAEVRRTWDGSERPPGAHAVQRQAAPSASTHRPNGARGARRQIPSATESVIDV